MHENNCINKVIKFGKFPSKFGPEREKKGSD